MQGIYIIKCDQEPDVYVGSSKDIASRWWHHKWLLKNNRHHSYKLQMAWNAYGDESFSFEVLEETNNFEEREQFWLDSVWPICYNILDKAGNNFSEENIKAMLDSRFAKRESYGTGNTLTETQVKEIIKRLNAGEAQKDIVKDYNIEVNSISNIKSGATWSHLNHLVNKDKADNKVKREESKAQAFILFAEGKTPRQVQDIIGRSKATVCRYRQEYIAKSIG
jgi:group I intron endonuclease